MRKVDIEVFDRKTGVITNYSEIKTLSVPIIIVPVMKVGDIDF